MKIISQYFNTEHFVLPSYAQWTIFGAIVLTLLFFDLFVFHKKGKTTSFKTTLTICITYVLIAFAFGIFVIYEKGLDHGALFYTGYLVELSLSMDNIFVISLVFTSLSIPKQYQHRVLFWGILGAIVMRAIMILLGDQLVSNFHWVLYVFSVFLIYTGIKMITADEHNKPLSESRLFKFIQKKFNVTDKLHDEKFFVRENNKLHITPLFFALIVIEIMDVIFAIDSIPAIFLITPDIFIIYTSNIFAILGLRSMYFLLAAAISKFTYLKHSLSLILIFIGAKIFLPEIGIEVTSATSLIVTFSLILGGIILSLIKQKSTPTT